MCFVLFFGANVTLESVCPNIAFIDRMKWSCATLRAEYLPVEIKSQGLFSLHHLLLQTFFFFLPRSFRSSRFAVNADCKDCRERVPLCIYLCRDVSHWKHNSPSTIISEK